MATLTHYEVAWNMYQAGSSMEQITQVVERHRATIYRWLHRRLTKPAVGVQRYHKHQVLVQAHAPREVIEHDTVDLGNLYAYTAIDIFSKEVSIFIGTDLTMETGAEAFAHHTLTFGWAKLHQSDNGSEFRSKFVEAVTVTGAAHRYSRPYKKNEQAHIENFNKSLRRECFGHIRHSPTQQPELELQTKLYAQHFFSERWHLGLPNMMTTQQFKESRYT